MQDACKLLIFICIASKIYINYEIVEEEEEEERHEIKTHIQGS